MAQILSPKILEFLYEVLLVVICILAGGGFVAFFKKWFGH